MTRRLDLSDRDLQLLSFVFQVGVADARQLERLAFPAGPGTKITAARRARRSLARLVDDGLLNRLDRRVGGVRAGSTLPVVGPSDCPAGSGVSSLAPDSWSMRSPLANCTFNSSKPTVSGPSPS